MLVQFTRDVLVGTRTHAAGSGDDVDEDVGKRLISEGSAVIPAGPAAETADEPRREEHRDEPRKDAARKVPDKKPS